MERRVSFYNGPLDGKSGIIHKDRDGWPARLAVYDESRKMLCVYKRHSNSRFDFAGYEPVPREEPVVLVQRDGKGGYRYSDPLGVNDYDDLPTPPLDHPDPLAFVSELFAGGRTHVLAGPSLLRWRQPFGGRMKVT